jgi:hypothetical protein
MITLPATVHGGVVKLPQNIQVADGSRVMITILMPRPEPKIGFLPEEILDEDVEFVRACRGRLARQLREVENKS